MTTTSTPPKKATSRAKPIRRKLSPKTSRKNQKQTKNSHSQASASSPGFEFSRHVSAFDKDEKPTDIDGVLNVDSDHIMELSSNDESVTDKPIEMSDESEDEEDEKAELCKTYLIEK
jgi:hypothetical protein